MAGLFDNNSMNCAINNMPLDNFASATVASNHDNNVIAVCIAHDEASQTSKCYVYTTYNCARKLAGSCGRGACERTCRVGGTDEHASFVREMMCSSSGTTAGPNTTPALFKVAKIGSDAMVDDKDVQKNGPLSSKNVKTTMMMSKNPFLADSEMASTTTTTSVVGENRYPVEIQTTLTITSNNDKKNTWYGFIADGALYLRGDGWGDMEIRESIVAVLELAEEQLGCEKVYLCLEKSNPDLAKLVRALMYADFEMVYPGVLPNADPKYLVMGI
ncbi:hypothetical protein BGW41_006295 [Actinomortierella wolfii]|nr:hypothetical protein BGW41_006295 [Actinomortierella wolfii]